MVATTSNLAGYRGLRSEVLVMLRKAQPLTAKELAAKFGVTPNALRRHLKALASEGLVCFESEIRGVGGPVYAYSLTDRGESLFPRAYANVLAGVLGAVRETEGSDGVERFVLNQMRRLAANGRNGTNGNGAKGDGTHAGSGAPGASDVPAAVMSAADRSRQVVELLTSQGYMAESATSATNELRIIEHNCAMHEIVREFPEICAAEAKFLAEALGGTVVREQHMLGGCNRCEYKVQM